MVNKIKKWEIWGAVFSVIVGSLFHFIYEWSGNNPIVAIFGAVNESTWEHLKMAFWPTLIFSIFEYLAIRKEINNSFLAIMIKLFSMPIIIVGLFYGWQALLHHNVIWDISSFVFAIIIGYVISYKILISKKQYNLETISLILMIAGIIKFSLFTYFPPQSFLTKDPNTGSYGIPKQYNN